MLLDLDLSPPPILSLKEKEKAKRTPVVVRLSNSLFLSDLKEFGGGAGGGKLLALESSTNLQILAARETPRFPRWIFPGMPLGLESTAFLRK